MDKLTVNEAIEQGYKYAICILSEGELIPFDKLDKCKTYRLASKEVKPFTIEDSLIKDLLEDYLCSQDEVADDDLELVEIASNVDYSEITNKINEAFSETKYHYATDIYLTFRDK